MPPYPKYQYLRRQPRTLCEIYTWIGWKYDYQVSYALAREFFSIIETPIKGFFTFENSAHSPNLEEREKFIQIVRGIASEVMEN